MARKYLDLDNSIIIHDVKQIKKEPPMSKIKTKNRLAKILFNKFPELGSETSIYHKMVRYEKNGLTSYESNDLISKIKEVLEVSEKELFI